MMYSVSIFYRAETPNKISERMRHIIIEDATSKAEALGMSLMDAPESLKEMPVIYSSVIEVPERPIL